MEGLRIMRSNPRHHFLTKDLHTTSFIRLNIIKLDHRSSEFTQRTKMIIRTRLIARRCYSEVSEEGRQRGNVAFTNFTGYGGKNMTKLSRGFYWCFNLYSPHAILY
uniref:Uncharacterized protein n=1 Tax=Cucumis melo TaxID=3656 RepID=A0A9I9ED19_CUCME